MRNFVSPLVYGPHEAYLTRTDKDTQRSKLYRAEREAFADEHRVFKTHQQRLAYLRKLMNEKWWKRRFSLKYRQCTIVENRRLRGWCWAFRPRLRIELSTKYGADKVWVTLHELAHLVVQLPHPGHGRLYARVYADIVKHKLGVDLRPYFKRHNVRYSKFKGKR